MTKYIKEETPKLEDNVDMMIKDIKYNPELNSFSFGDDDFPEDYKYVLKRG